MIVLLLCNFAIAQEVSEEREVNQKKERKLRPFRLGAKIGFPNVIGGNIEYVTPLLEKKLAVSIDYSKIKSGWFEVEEEGNINNSPDSQLDLSYLEGGINYYFFKPGRGLYGNLSYGIIKINGIVYSESEDGLQNGSGSLDFSNGSVNINVGAKLGGLFYFRPEVGYSFNPPPRTIEYQVRFSDGTTENRTETFEENTPADLLFKGLIANIGIGFAF